MSDSVRPHRWQPIRLPRPWDSPGKNTGVSCHFLLQCRKVKSESEVAQSCPTLVTPWTAAHQAPPSMGFFRQKYRSGVPLMFFHFRHSLLISISSFLQTHHTHTHTFVMYPSFQNIYIKVLIISIFVVYFFMILPMLFLVEYHGKNDCSFSPELISFFLSSINSCPFS